MCVFVHVSVFVCEREQERREKHVYAWLKERLVSPCVYLFVLVSMVEGFTLPHIDDLKVLIESICLLLAPVQTVNKQLQ